MFRPTASCKFLAPSILVVHTSIIVGQQRGQETFRLHFYTCGASAVEEFSFSYAIMACFGTLIDI